MIVQCQFENGDVSPLCSPLLCVCLRMVAEIGSWGRRWPTYNTNAALVYFTIVIVVIIIIIIISTFIVIIIIVIALGLLSVVRS